MTALFPDRDPAETPQLTSASVQAGPKAWTSQTRTGCLAFAPGTQYGRLFASREGSASWGPCVAPAGPAGVPRLLHVGLISPTAGIGVFLTALQPQSLPASTF